MPGKRKRVTYQMREKLNTSRALLVEDIRAKGHGTVSEAFARRKLSEIEKQVDEEYPGKSE